MSETWLLLDLGNSRLKWCVARDGRLETDDSGVIDELAAGELGALIERVTPARVALSSVARSERDEVVRRAVRASTGEGPERFASVAEQAGLINAYPEPARLGVDRWLAMLGACDRHGHPAIVADVGTATTLDAVDAAGRHLGGWILPGPQTMARSLFEGTDLAASLPTAPVLSPATSTGEAIVGGISGAQVGAARCFIAAVESQLGGAATLVTCGGGGEALASGMMVDAPDGQPPVVHDPWLIFAGMLVAMEGGSRR